MQLLFLCYQPNCYKGFTFTTTRCRLKLTQHILTFCARRSLRMTSFIVCSCRFACKIGACGPLIYWWYCWKIFAANFYTRCFDRRGNSTGKKLTRLNWEKDVYQPLFTLVNTLFFFDNSIWVQLWKNLLPNQLCLFWMWNNILVHFLQSMCPFLLWMRFNCLKAAATSRRQFTFYHSVLRNSWYSFYRPWKDERLSRPWSHPVVLITGPRD